MTELQKKFDILLQHYSQTDIAKKLTSLSGREVPLQTVNKYISGVNKAIRVKVVQEALEALVEETKAL